MVEMSELCFNSRTKSGETTIHSKEVSHEARDISHEHLTSEQVSWGKGEREREGPADRERAG